MEHVTEHIKYRCLSYKSFIKYIQSFIKLVESKFKQKLPNKFSMMFHGRSDFDTYYVAMYALYSSNNEIRYSYYLWCFLPLENKANHFGKYEKQFSYVLGLFGKEFSNVVAIFADSCATNRINLRNISCSFVGRARQR